MSPSARLVLIIVLALASITAITLAFRYDHEIREALVTSKGRNGRRATTTSSIPASANSEITLRSSPWEWSPS